MDPLEKIQNELEVVKDKLRENGVHLGMRGETLQRYLLQLNEKENLLLSRHIKGMPGAAEARTNGGAPATAPAPASAAVAQAAAVEVAAAAVPQPAAAEPLPAAAAAEEPQAVVEPAQPVEAAPAAAPASPTNGRSPTAAAVAQPVPPVPRLQPRDAPEGEPAPFNKEDVSAVLEHMCVYEAVPLESAKALRALSSLSYADAKSVGEDESVVQQLLRLGAIHPGVEKVQLGAVRALCNMAYDVTVARERLSDPSVLAALIGAMAVHPSSKDIAAKAGEAVARIVMSETQVEVEDGAAAAPVVPKGRGALDGLFAAAAAGDPSWHRVVLDLISQLLSNEVAEPPLLAERFTGASEIAHGGDAAAAALGWLGLARQLSAPGEPTQLPDALVGAGAINATTRLMESYSSEANIQLAGIEALSSLVGNRWDGLQRFAEAGGARHIDAAMRVHGGNPLLQIKGVRALVCAINWPEDVQQKSGYDVHSAIALTKDAMTQHLEDSELQKAALEALAKYLDKMACHDEVKAEGGEGMVKAVMTRHRDEDGVQKWGKVVLDGLGSDRHWEPRNNGQ